ncbi:hypothetical protein SAMD00019534_002670 [Acytostelium subglobosum LB1]|uniref:hypothetical protein n=1 Tax=Acytostelium subglobosum LB1 TaxID=1410327 RepID=UPI000644AB7F|nr:hypothetical protein SAMD00019534_002670 [Acytostelium subglobosum LB1]GAM17092.1 hypothetical protein SAMD00019534_002670 [Acytostelium subglobosum LB1]|eukprot:XP_012759154.1 hypothetical protein SAMD00019534_002670 [Acytostelium subglobosum LB1]
MTMLNNVLEQWKGIPGFDNEFFKYLEMGTYNHEKKILTMTMVVPQELCNVLSTLHGGAMATLVDVVSSIAIIASDPERMPPSVSVDLSVSYAATAPVGEKITIESTVLKIGKNLAFTDTAIYNNHNKIVCKGSHTKFIHRKAAL